MRKYFTLKCFGYPTFHFDLSLFFCKKKTSFPSCTDSVIRNDSTRIVQPEVVFPMRSESHGSPNGPIERKGTVAIGQSVFYTDFPPKEYGGHSGKFALILFW